MSEQEPGTELVLAHSGQLVNLESLDDVAAAFKEVKRVSGLLREAEVTLRRVLQEHATYQGTKTLHVDGVGKVEVRGGEGIEWPDPIGLSEALLAAGMPDDVVNEIVLTEIKYKVDARRAQRAASANPAYAEIIGRHRVTVERTPQVTIS